MKKKNLKLIFVLLIFLGVSCKKSTHSTTTIVKNTIYKTFSSQNTIKGILHEKELLSGVDSMDFSKNANLEKLLMIEFYTTNSYVVTNVDVLLVQYYNNATIFYMKYDRTAGRWKRLRKVEIANSEAVKITSKFLSLMNDNTSNNLDLSITDVIRFSSFNTSNQNMKSVTEVNCSDNLTKMFTKLFSLHNAESL